MSEQNLKSHSRYIPLWHFITPVLLLAVLAVSIINLVHGGVHSSHTTIVPVLISILMIVIFWYARWFALRAQDRAIRAEENFRHFILTGKPLDKQLGLGQIIALRFASDEELPLLAKKAAEGNLSPKQIKEAIKNWRGDFNRV